jgi:hypothetical protein
MKFCVSLLSALMCLASGAVNAHETTDVVNVEVLGVYFAPSAHVASSIVKAIDASEHEVLVLSLIHI